MISQLNNADILKFGNFNHNQIFFIQRWIELLNIHTHSKYSVRYLNTHQALKELNYVCKEMIEGNIKRNDHHLFIIFEEVKKVIKEDQIFKDNAPSHSRILENSLQKAPRSDNISKLYSIIYQIEYVMRYVEKDYLEWIITKLNNLLSSHEQQCEEIEKAMKILASELLGKGWSINELYLSIDELVLTEGKSVSENLNIYLPN